MGQIQEKQDSPSNPPQGKKHIGITEMRQFWPFDAGIQLACKVFETKNQGCSNLWFRHTSMNSDHTHQVPKPTSRQLTRILTCPMPCLQESVSLNKAVAKTLMMSLVKHILCSREWFSWINCSSKTLCSKWVYLEEEWESKGIWSIPLKRGRAGRGRCKRREMGQLSGRWLWSRSCKPEHYISLWGKGRIHHLDGLGRAFMPSGVEFLFGSWWTVSASRAVHPVGSPMAFSMSSTGESASLCTTHRKMPPISCSW